MKTKLTKGKQKPEYPYMGIDEYGQVVLFSESGRGTVLVAPDKEDYQDVGYNSTSWLEENFNPLPRGSKVTLEN